MSNAKYGIQADGSYKPAPRVQDALSALLKACGFDTMADDVLTESEHSRLQQYARVIARNYHAEPARKAQVINSLRALNLI